MANRKAKLNRRQDRGSFLSLPHVLLEHECFRGLSPRAVNLLVDIASQYRGNNNGDLTIAWTFMHGKRGWTSKDQLYKARDELLAKGFIVVTRYGKRPNVAGLYAITWRGIDESGGKLERKPGPVPLNYRKSGTNPEYS